MRDVLERSQAAEPDASLALDVYLHRLRAGIAAMAAALGGVDVLVFTGGVGERAAAVRASAVDGLSFLGVGIDAERNRRAESDAEIGGRGATVRTFVLTAREDLEIALAVRGLLGPQDAATTADR